MTSDATLTALLVVWFGAIHDGDIHCIVFQFDQSQSSQYLSATALTHRLSTHFTIKPLGHMLVKKVLEMRRVIHVCIYYCAQNPGALQDQCLQTYNSSRSCQPAT